MHTSHSSYAVVDREEAEKNVFREGCTLLFGALPLFGWQKSQMADLEMTAKISTDLATCRTRCEARAEEESLPGLL